MSVTWQTMSRVIKAVADVKEIDFEVVQWSVHVSAMVCWVLLLLLESFINCIHMHCNVCQLTCLDRKT